MITGMTKIFLYGGNPRDEPIFSRDNSEYDSAESLLRNIELYLKTHRIPGIHSGYLRFNPIKFFRWNYSKREYLFQLRYHSRGSKRQLRLAFGYWRVRGPNKSSSSIISSSLFRTALSPSSAMMYIFWVSFWVELVR